MWLIVGLGNPGNRYRDTRHNAGFRVIEHLGARHSIEVGMSMYLARTGRGCLGTEPVILVKPSTYMNRSGLSVAAAVRGFQVNPDRVVVIHDDIDIESGSLKLKRDGGSGGHRGVESIIWALGTSLFVRVRVGIGRPSHGWDAAEYVLERLNSSEIEVFDLHCLRVAEAVESLVLNGYEETVRDFHGKGRTESKATV